MLNAKKKIRPGKISLWHSVPPPPSAFSLWHVSGDWQGAVTETNSTEYIFLIYFGTLNGLVLIKKFKTIKLYTENCTSISAKEIWEMGVKKICGTAQYNSLKSFWIPRVKVCYGFTVTSAELSFHTEKREL